MSRSLIIYSGGMDSTCLLFSRQSEIGLAVTFDYGSKHNDMEYIYALRNTKALGIEHLLVDVRSAFKHHKSDLLLSGGAIPEGHYEHESMTKTVVPFRNGIMLSIAAGIAESRGLKTILLANHFGDHAIYPDCRDNFIKAMKLAIGEGTATQVTIDAPFTMISKRQIALIGRDYGVPFIDTYSCYNGEKMHCGKCGTCVERKEALEGFDPTSYRS